MVDGGVELELELDDDVLFFLLGEGAAPHITFIGGLRFAVEEIGDVVVVGHGTVLDLDCIELAYALPTCEYVYFGQAHLVLGTFEQ